MEVLVTCGITSLPVNLNVILKYFGVRAYPYSRNWNQLRALGMEDAAQSTSGLAFYRDASPIIMYDDRNTTNRIRFTVAHELGHIALGHVLPGEYTVVNREPSPSDSPMERAANHFAIDLLAPACVLWGMNLHTAAEIEEVCAISAQAAQFRAQRMEQFYRLDKFLSTPLEMAVYRQFLPFIREWRVLH